MVKLNVATARELRLFGLTVGLAAAVFAAWGFWRPGFEASPIRMSVWAVSAILVVFGMAAPRLLAWPHRVWMAAAAVLGNMVTTVLLTAFFLLVITPAGLVLRVLGRDPLQMKPGSRDTYWQRSDPDPRGPEKYEHPF